MPETAIAAEVHQALDVHGDLTAQVALDRELSHALAQTLHLRLGQVLDFRRAGNARRVANLPGRGPTDSVDGGQRNNRVLMIRDINPSNTSHSQSSERKTKNYNTSTRHRVDSVSNLPTSAGSTLALLVPRIITDPAHNALATHDLALATHFLDRSLHSHGFLHSLTGSRLPVKIIWREKRSGPCSSHTA